MAARRLVNGQPVEMTPAEEAAFDAARAPTLPQAKRDARDRIANRRELAEIGGFAFAAKRYASRSLDLARLALLAERARIAKAEGGTVSYRATAMDDTESAMNADELIAMERAAADHLIACSTNARTLRQAVNAAADVAAVFAIDIEAGWP